VSRRKQLWLPEVGKVERLKKEPQPRLGKIRSPKKFEIVHHPLSLRFRGRLNKWLVKLDKLENIKIEKILNEEEIRIFGLYFFPQGKSLEWLTQEDVLKKTDHSSKKKLRNLIKNALVKLWEKSNK
jgi:hypothetical protein